MKARIARTIHYVVLGTALIIAAAIPSIVSPSLASAASPAFVQGTSTQVGSGTTASVAFPGANTAGNLIVVYVVWDNPDTVTVSDTKRQHLHGRDGPPELGVQLEYPGLLRPEHPRRVEHGQGDLWDGDHVVRHRGRCTSTPVSPRRLRSTSVRLPPARRRP